jgi:hypothetical protein
MREVIISSWIDRNRDLEGYCPYPYLDELGLVTTGVGNLVDARTGSPPASFLALPWRRPGGALASSEEKAAAWRTVHARQDLAKAGGAAFASLTTIRLDRDAIEVMVRQRLLENDALLRRRFPAFDSWPADAQFAAHSMAWAMGEHRLDEFPHFCAAARAAPPDWKTMAKQCRMQPDRGVVHTRNDRNAALFLAAATAQDPDRLST